jgi:hypothetical protein
MRRASTRPHGSLDLTPLCLTRERVDGIRLVHWTIPGAGPSRGDPTALLGTEKHDFRVVMLLA